MSGAFPTAVLIYGQVFGLFVQGRQLGIMLALSPILFIFLPTGLSLYGTVRTCGMDKMAKLLAALAVMFIGQAWATLVCWLATDYNFMGAGC